MTWKSPTLLPIEAMLEKKKFHINAVHKSIMWRKRQLYIQDLDETEECSVLPASIQDIKIKEE